MSIVLLTRLDRCVCHQSWGIMVAFRKWNLKYTFCRIGSKDWIWVVGVAACKTTVSTRKTCKQATNFQEYRSSQEKYSKTWDNLSYCVTNSTRYSSLMCDGAAVEHLDFFFYGGFLMLYNGGRTVWSGWPHLKTFLSVNYITIYC